MPSNATHAHANAGAADNGDDDGHADDADDDGDDDGDDDDGASSSLDLVVLPLMMMRS